LRLLVTGGGTGGHVYPALAVAREILESEPSSRVLYVGARRGLEADVVPGEEGIDFMTVPAAGLVGKSPAGAVHALAAASASFARSLALIARFRPHAALGTGGYVSGPVILASAALGVPFVLQEQNAVPGVTNRMLARFASSVCVGFEEAGRRLPRRARVVVTGNPVRGLVLDASRDEARRSLRIAEDRTVVLVMSGSGGARTINDAACEALPALLERDDLHVVYSTGRRYFESVKARLSAAGIEDGFDGKLTMRPYICRVGEALAAADLVVSRAGGTSIAEITAVGVPAVLVPSPNAPHDQQLYNARAAERAGGAVVIADSAFDGRRMAAEVSALVDDRGRLERMARCSAGMGRPDAAARVAGELRRAGARRRR